MYTPWARQISEQPIPHLNIVTMSDATNASAYTLMELRGEVRNITRRADQYREMFWKVQARDEENSELLRKERAKTRMLEERSRELERELDCFRREKRPCLSVFGKDPMDPPAIEALKESGRRAIAISESEAMWREEKLRTEVMRLHEKDRGSERYKDRAQKYLMRKLHHEIETLEGENRTLVRLNNTYHNFIIADQLKKAITLRIDDNQQARLRRDQWLHDYNRFVPRQDRLAEHYHVNELLGEPPEALSAYLPLKESYVDQLNDLHNEYCRLLNRHEEIRDMEEHYGAYAEAMEALPVSIYYGWRWP